jgi:hypothetical protein
LVTLALLSTSPALARGLSLPSPDPDRGSIAVTLRLRPPLGPAASAVQVYFVRLEERAGILEATHVLRSNLSDKKQVYLLNCEPGRYVAVGGELRPKAARMGNVLGGAGMEYKVFLDQEAIAATEIVVERGAVAFMGEVLVDSKVKINQADAAQSHFLRLLEPDMARHGYTVRALSGSALYLGTLLGLDRSPATETAFLNVAERNVFKKHAAWQSLVRELHAARAR